MSVYEYACMLKYVHADIVSHRSLIDTHFPNMETAAGLNTMAILLYCLHSWCVLQLYVQRTMLKLRDCYYMIIFHNIYVYNYVSLIKCRLEATNIPQDAQDRLADIVEKLKADPEREKLDVNYLHHGTVIAQAIEKQKQTAKGT